MSGCKLRIIVNWQGAFKQRGIKQGLPSSMYFTMREERRLRVFNNTVLRIFEPKKDEVTGKCRRLHMRRCMLCTPNQILFW
jgi:hypothetical protein